MARLQTWTSPRGLLEITPQSIASIEQAIRWAEYEVPQRIPIEMDKLIRYMAIVNQSVSRKMAGGPLDPREKRPELAWRTPERGIRRISQRYFLGWKLKRKGIAWWQVYNDSREAYYIEFGISTVGFGGDRRVSHRRIRRPVRKLAMLKTMRFMMTTQAYHRCWCDIYANPKTKRMSGGFTQVVQSPAKGSFQGPMLGRRLPD